MKNLFGSKNVNLFIKSNPWVLGLLAITVYLLITVSYNTVSSVEAQTLLAYKIILNGMNFATNSEIPSSPLVPLIFAGGDLVGGVVGARIISLVFSILSLYFFYKFTFLLLKNRDSAFFSLLLLAISAPFIFMSKTASWSIISFAFLSAFLYINQKNIEESSNSLLLNILPAILLFLAVTSNYILIVFVPFFIIGVLFEKKLKTHWLQIFLLILLLIFYVIILPSSLNRFLNIFSRIGHHGSVLKEIISLIQHLIIPFMLFTAMFLERSKYYFSTNQYMIFLGLGLIMPVTLLFAGDDFTIIGNLAFSVLFIAPLTGVMLKDYIIRHANTKYAVIIVLFLSSILSFYQVRLFENSYPNMKESAVKLVETAGLNSVITGENTEILKYYLFPKVLLNQFNDIRHSPDANETDSRSRKILEAVINGKTDFIFINELINPELGERIRDAVNIKYYFTLHSEDYKISTALYPVSEGRITIYKLK